MLAISYESYTLGLHIPVEESQQKVKNQELRAQEPITANLGDLNPFWVGARLLCVKILVECLR